MGACMPKHDHIDGLIQDCGNSSVLAKEYHSLTPSRRNVPVLGDAILRCEDYVNIIYNYVMGELKAF